MGWEEGGEEGLVGWRVGGHGGGCLVEWNGDVCGLRMAVRYSWMHVMTYGDQAWEVSVITNSGRMVSICANSQEV